MFKSLEILMVEDNFLEVEFVKDTLKTSMMRHNLYVVCNGEDAMKFLNKVGQYKTKPTPDFIMLDLDLPKKNGREVLIEIKLHDNFKNIPLVILASSSDVNDIKMAYENYADHYLTKPINLGHFKRIVKSLRKIGSPSYKLKV